MSPVVALVILLVVGVLVYVYLQDVRKNGPCERKWHAWMFYGEDRERVCAETKATRAILNQLTRFTNEPSIFDQDPDVVKIRTWVSIRQLDELPDEATVRELLEDIRTGTCLVLPTDRLDCPETYTFRDGCCLSDTATRLQDSDEYMSTFEPSIPNKLEQGLMITAAILPDLMGGFILDKYIDSMKIAYQKRVFRELKAGGFQDQAVKFVLQGDIDRLVAEIGEEVMEQVSDMVDEVAQSARYAELLTQRVQEVFRRVNQEIVEEGGEEVVKRSKFLNSQVKNPILVRSLGDDVLTRVVDDVFRETQVAQKSFTKLAARGTVLKQTTKTGMMASLRTAVKQPLQQSSKMLLKFALRQGSKMAAKMSAMASKFAMYAAAGPVGAALMVFDVVSMLVDMWDPLSFNTFSSIEVGRQIRDGIEVHQRMNLQNMGYPLVLHPNSDVYDDDGPILYSASLVFPTEWSEATAEYTRRLIELVFEDETLREELQRYLDDRLHESELLSETRVRYEVSADCPMPLPEWGWPATDDQAETLDRVFRALPSERSDAETTLLERWERRDDGTWIETPEEAERLGRGCASSEFSPCPCRVVQSIPNFEAIFDVQNEMKLDAILDLYTNRVELLSYRIAPRTRARLMYECLMRRLSDPVDRTKVCFCPEMLPADDHPAAGRFDAIDRAIGLSKAGFLQEYDRLVQDRDGNVRETLVNQVHGDPVFFPIWTDTYRVRDGVEPGTTKLPNARTKKIPVLTVFEIVPNGTRVEGVEVSRERYDDAYEMVAYNRARFAQSCALGSELVKCLHGVSKDTGDLFGIIPGSYKCNTYRVSSGTWEPVSDLPPEYYAEYTKEPKLHTQSRCEGNIRNELRQLFPGDPTYSTRWEPKAFVSSLASSRIGVNPKEYGVTFDFDTGLCKYTKDFCTRYGLQYKGLEDGSYDCKPFPGQGVFEFVLGTTVTRSGIMAAMMADKQLSLAQDKMVASCKTGQRAIAGLSQNGADSLQTFSCLGSFTVQSFRSFLQVSFALMGGALMPLEKTASQTMQEVMNSMKCITDATKDKFNTKKCLGTLTAPFRIAAAGLEGAWMGAGYALDSTTDAIGDMVSALGLDGQAVEDALNDLRDYVGEYSGLNAFYSNSIDLFQGKTFTVQDSTLEMKVPFSPWRFSIGQNTNVCFGAVCADDVGDAVGKAAVVVGKELEKGFKKFKKLF